MNNLKRRLQTGEPGTSNEPPPGRPSSRGFPVCSGPSVTFELQSMGQAHVSIGNDVFHGEEEGISNCLSGFDDSKGCAKSEEGFISYDDSFFQQ